MSINFSEFQYGCWGQVGNHDIPGKGEPLDEIDIAFRNWHMCRNCAAIDDEGECAINQTPYEIGKLLLIFVDFFL